jgi:hypothetical protein
MVTHFTGRETYLNRLHEMIVPNGAISRHSVTNVIVILANGGMGKTQLVLQYISQYPKLFSAVFWVNASSLETTQTSFISIAEQLIKHYAKMQTGSLPDYVSIARRLDMVDLVDEKGRIVVGENSPTLVVKAVKAWLALDGNHRWLIVFDNVDDLESFDVSESFPYKNSLGNVIITTRRRDCMDYGTGFELKEMEESESIELLFKFFDKQIEHVGSEGAHRIVLSALFMHIILIVFIDFNEAQRIARRLGQLPLAIHQAGAYLRKLRRPLKDYLPLFEQNMKHMLSKKPLGAAWAYRDDTVFTTWEISFKAIQDVDPKSAELLLVCSFLSNEDIWEDLLQRGSKSLDIYKTDGECCNSTFGVG